MEVMVFDVLMLAHENNVVDDGINPTSMALNVNDNMFSYFFAF